MASTNANWAVVGKAKKGKGTPPHLTKTQKKQFVANMPKVDALDPMKESSTIYDAFVAKEEQRLARKQQERFADKIEAGKDMANGKGLSDGTSKKKPSNKNKKTEQVVRKRPYPEVAKEVLEEDLKSVLLQSKGHFPDKPELWLKDLVTYLNMKLEYAIQDDHYLSFDTKDYLTSSLKKGCVKVLSSLMNETNAATLEHVWYFCVVTMLEEAQNGAATYGYKIFLQLIARVKPDVVLAKLAQYKELVKTTQNRPDRCLSVLWALGQVGQTSIKAALRVWLEIMFPNLSLRSISNYCIQYLENLLSKNSNDLVKAAGEITLREYFYILDQVYGTFLPADLRKRLLAVYPVLKMLAYGRNSSTTLRNFFPSYLTRATLDCPAGLKTEVMSCLMECLSQDKHTFSLWCQLYLKHLPQSKVLMSHLSDNWETVSGSVDKKMLQQTLMTFMRTNEEMSQGRNSGEWGQMTAVCEELLKKMTRPRFPWRWLMFILVSTVLAIVAYDIFASKSLKDSRTVGFLEAYGVMGLLRQVFETMTLYGSLVYGWLEVNVPVYSELAYTTVSPYVVRVINFCYHIEEYTRDHRRQIIDSVYGFAPDLWNEFGRYLSLLWDFIIQYSLWIQEHIVQLYLHLRLWVHTHIINGDFSSDNIQDTLQWSAIRVQNMTASVVHWAKSLLT